MTIIAEDGARRAGREPDMAALDNVAQQIIATYDAESTAFYATARLWDDGLVDPRDTRRVLALCLAVCREAAARQLRPNSFGVARM
jgi:geranyl-CoA carboxylase beta subunit